MTATAFASLPLSAAMQANLAAIGYAEMTPIQAASLPLILKGRDLIAQAKTGSGKTAAFGIGLLHPLNPRYFGCQAMVLCPTRELADQVAKEIRRLARAADNIKVLTLCGGVPFGPQIGSLEHGAHVIVGTPGRVQEHLRKGTLKVDGLNTLVLDEADRMLDMGFVDSISDIIEQTPRAGRPCCSPPPTRPASNNSPRASCATRSGSRSRRSMMMGRSNSASTKSPPHSAWRPSARCCGISANSRWSPSAPRASSATSWPHNWKPRRFPPPPCMATSNNANGIRFSRYSPTAASACW